MLAAYFDEGQRTKGTFAVAGFAYRRADVKRCGREWLKLFGPYGGCHMTDLALRQGRFKGISAAEANRLMRGAVAIINDRACYGVAVSCNLDEMGAVLPKWIDGFQSAYPVCCHIAMLALGNLIRATGPLQKVAYFFESGHEHQAAAHRFMSRVADTPALADGYLHESHMFARKSDLVQLQTADVLAWEWAKYLDETVSRRKRNMRRSLAAILNFGSAMPTEPNKGRIYFTHITGKPLETWATKVTQLGLLQIEEERSGV